MANITVQKEGERGLTRPRQEWDPASTIRQFFGWDPFQEMTPLLRQEAGFIPAFEVKETKDGYLFRADLPGVKESDVEITVTGNRMSISGKREAEKEEKSDTYYTYERSYGSFSRAFTMPEAANMSSVHADLRDGVLTVHVGRKAEAQPQKIPIQAGSKA